MEDDAISISDASGDEEYLDRRAILEPAIRSVVDALGGYENGSYRLGDECYGCLKDLKKLWRKDDTDDERTVARIFWETRVLPNDLVPILLETAGKGLLEDKCAIACADLMTAMTWPIDMAEELKELDEEHDKGTDYTQLALSHLHYKAALLRPGVIQALFGITLPCLAKSPKERKERDIQIINVVLYLIRNLAFIKDLPPNMHLSADQAEFSSLQSRLVKTLSDANVLDFLVTIASSVSTDPMFNGWNALVLEMFYLLFRGITPSSLASDQSKEPTQNLRRLLAVEDQRRRDFRRNATSRHSRFGTTLSVKLNPKKSQAKAVDEEAPQADAEPAGASQTLVLHHQQALNRDSGSIVDQLKKQRKQKSKKVDELAREDNLSVDAKLLLQNLARTFIEACFNSFLSSLLKDIRAERAKITEKDNLRLLYVAKWFLEFFLCVRASQGSDNAWSFGLIAEVTDRAWIVWVLKRMRQAVEEKPKAWNELQAGIDCLTQLVLLIDAMSTSPVASEADVADVLQQQLIYNGEVLDLAFDSLRAYRENTQSLAYLDSSVHLAYALFRMLERWGKKRSGKGEMYVRRKEKARRRKGEDDGVPDEEEEPQVDQDDMIHETMFTFDMFEAKFAHSDITQTLLSCVSRYKEFTSADKMKRVVSLMHRQAVKAKAEGLYFNVSTLDLFKNILADEKSMPKDQPYKDLMNLINTSCASFSRPLRRNRSSLSGVFPMNRGHWKEFSSWTPEEKKSGRAEKVEDTRFPQDVQVKKGYSWSEQLGIAIACLVEEGKIELIDWVKQILMLAMGQRQRIIEDTDGSSSNVIDVDSDDEHENELAAVTAKRGPSEEALAKITDYLIPYVTDEQANAATQDPHLKLLFRLIKFEILDEDANELEWHIPAAILPSDLQSYLNVINQFLESPIELDGKKASQLLNKKRRRRRRRRSPSPDPDASASEGEEPKKRKEKKKKEKQQYKSAQFIEDSDAEMEDLEAFLEKEKALRERTALLAASTGHIATMRPTGTKKRRKRATDDGGAKKRRRKGRKGADAEEEVEEAQSAPKGDDSDSDDSDLNLFGSPRRSPSTQPTSPDPVEAEPPKPRPRPRPRRKLASEAVEDTTQDPHPTPANAEDRTVKSPSPLPSALEVKKKGRLQLVTSDGED
ncbi:timeless protein-domain-containing protein [Fomitopsis serialis]|uniref:timeless protein-domain-containing protein n=1 Tax=Fomitopsis serialis TaxID=139415 RepID=UPI00200893F9|nr:timeless protein-domain-containing protein [Neoantrodia serialis]KAH9931521.1 timeless protein-domain-containing protein [Neoantrodia serialis]